MVAVMPNHAGDFVISPLFFESPPDVDALSGERLSPGLVKRRRESFTRLIQFQCLCHFYG